MMYGKQDLGAPPAYFAWLPRPRSARLAPDGTISWRWHTRARVEGLDPLQTTRVVPARRIPVQLAKRFAALADKPDETICRFAGDWGPLRYPRTTDRDSGDTELVQQWRRFAVLARAILRSAVAVSERTKGHSEDWLSICTWLNIPPEARPNAHLGLWLVVSALNQWYGRSSGNSIVEIHGNGIVIRPRSGFLFGILGLQLAWTVTATRDSLACYHCGALYRPNHKPRTGSRTFCPRCRRKGKPQLYAMRDLRDRQRVRKKS